MHNSPIDPLDALKLFYIKYPKPVHFEHKVYIPGTNEVVSSREGLDKVLEVDEPELRQVVDEHFERQIQQLLPVEKEEQQRV